MKLTAFRYRCVKTLGNLSAAGNTLSATYCGRKPHMQYIYSVYVSIKRRNSESCEQALGFIDRLSYIALFGVLSPPVVV